MKKDLICIATPKWYGNYLKSTVQLMEEMTESHRVLYVDYPYTFKDVFKGLFGRRDIPLLAVLGLGKRVVEITLDNGRALSLLRLPPMIPINWLDSTRAHDRLAKWNSQRAARSIRKAMRQLKFKEPVVVNAFQPTLGRWMKGAFDESRLIYYCYDDIGSAHWLGKHGERLEIEFMDLADEIVVTSIDLAKRKKRGRSPVSVVRNGVDFDLFSSGKQLDQRRPRKVVGYLGTIDDRIDCDLLEAQIVKFPELDFKFVGRCISPAVMAKLSKFKNVEFCGPRPKTELGQEVSDMDVCIIPFVKNQFTKAIYPLKINEYLAQGKPVICTHFADLSDFYGIIYTAKSHSGFEALLKTALDENDSELKKRRIAFAAANSWKSRASELATIIAG